MKFSNGGLDNKDFVALFRMPHAQFFDLVERRGGDKEDASKLLDELMNCIYETFPKMPRGDSDAGSDQS